MADFSPICEWVLRQEDATLSGKIVNLGDGGGLTRYGIAQTKHDNIPAYFYDCSAGVALAYAKVIYLKEYWDRFLGDEIFSDEVASCLFSFAVNDGNAREVKMLQQAVGVPVDGMMGPVTLAKVNAADDGRLASALRYAQASFYQTLALTRPDIARELPGLLNRAYRVYPSLT